MGTMTAEKSELILNVFLIAMTVFSIALRFLLRATSKASLGADDWWVLASLMVFYTTLGLQLWSKFPCKVQLDY